MAERWNQVENHYTSHDLGEVILNALRGMGKDVEQLTPDDLAPVDEFHGGQRPATIRLAELLGLTGTERVLDVGSGLGGPSRFLAWRYGVHVSGVDLTAEFVEVARMLTRRTGLDGMVDYRQGDALDLPFADASFDVVWSQNAAMNIADRDRLYREMQRVLKPGGRLALQEVAAGPGGAPHFPVQWAREPSISFLYSAAETRAKLEAAGFRVVTWQDTTPGGTGGGCTPHPQHRRRPAAARNPPDPRPRLAGDVPQLRPQPRRAPHRTLQHHPRAHRLIQGEHAWRGEQRATRHRFRERYGGFHSPYDGRAATPWRAGQIPFSRVRWRVFPKNLPVTL